MDAEMAGYGQRMEAMLAVALDEAAVSSLCGELQQQGLQLWDCGQLQFGAAQAAAWTLIATRPPQP
jgi:hypothetical protein